MRRFFPKKRYLRSVKQVKDFERRVGDFIRRQGLMEERSRVLVCVSGGADSVALLLVLTRLGYACRVVHCNFHLRGKESQSDEAFVRQLCEGMGVALDVVDFDTQTYASERKISIEMAAREQRYEAFERLRTQYGLDTIAVGHHAEDSAETMLLNLLRGTGIDGLTGIRPRNGFIIRPLLEVTRGDIIDYLTALGQTWVDDSSNATDDYARNRIRHRLLPLMEDINPAALQNILTTARNLRGTADLLDEKATDEAAVTLLHRYLAPHGYNSTQSENLLEALRNHRTTLIPRSVSALQVAMPSLRFSIEKVEQGNLRHSNDVLLLDVQRLTAPLTLRRWREGDRFCPFGMGRRTKLVSDLLTDCHLSRAERESQMVLCVGDDIAWVVGLRSDERFRVLPTATEVLVVEKTEILNQQK